jgi:hypothetical protein
VAVVDDRERLALLDPEELGIRDHHVLASHSRYIAARGKA